MTTLVIVGQGYVGLPLASGAVRARIKVIGLDSSEETVVRLNAGESHVDDINDAELIAMLKSGYSATTDPKVIAGADVVVICVPTPMEDGGRPDLSAIISAANAIADNLTPNTLVVLESTTYPGTTTDLVLPILLRSGLALDEDFHLAFSPERIDPGNAAYGLRNTPKIVGGVSSLSTKSAYDFYSLLVDSVVVVKGTKEAETAKLLENTYRHVNIALVNEMAKFCHELDIDIWEVIGAASTKPFGFAAFYPGPGVGGHCIPIDPNYLSYEVKRALGYPFRFVELAQEINNSMPRYVVDRIQDALNDESLSLRGSRVFLLGVTYKANIKDQRESPAIPIALALQAKGALVQFHDPRVSSWDLPNASLHRENDLGTAVTNADIVVLLQNHDEYDADALAGHSRLFFDCRGAVSDSNAIRL